MNKTPEFVTPQWDCPANVVAYSSTRKGGVSSGDFEGLNVGAHVGDDLLLVRANRSVLPHHEKITWLEQVHSNKVVSLPSIDTTADAAISTSPNFFCAVMTADCVPILVCSKRGDAVAAIHAGWKGLHTNVIANTINTLKLTTSELMAWIGPAISVDCYEVDETLAQQFAQYPNAIKKSTAPGKYLLDLPLISETQLRQNGVESIYQSGLCTYTHEEMFYSHRSATHKRKRSTGRIVSVIGLTTNR